MSDFELALMLQREFNDEHDSYVNEAELRVRPVGGSTSLRCHALRPPHTSASCVLR
jgi:hypothetical protein